MSLARWNSKKSGSFAFGLILIFCVSVLYTNCSGQGFQVNEISEGQQSLGSQEPSAVAINFQQAPPDTITASNATLSFEVSGSNLSTVQMKCYLNDVVQSSCQSPLQLTSLEDLDYTVTVEAINQNQFVLAQAKRSFRVDRKAPTLTLNQAPGAQIGATSAMISFSVTDNFPDAVAYCSLDNAAAAVCASPLSLTNLAQGAHTVKIYGQDKAGNKSATQTVSFSVVLGVPSVTLSQMPAAFSNSNAADFSFNGSSSNSTIASYECSMDNGAYAACTSPKAYTGLVEGSHNFAVRAKDALGQVSSPVSYSFQVDLTKPSVPVVNSDSMNPSKNTSLNLSFNSTDASGIASFECKVDGSAFASCVSPKAYANLSSASHSFAVRAIDKAGNVSNEGSYTLVIDTTPPTVTITMKPEPSTQVTSASFAFTVTDALSGVNMMECQPDNQAYAACTSPKAYNNLVVGNHTFNIRGSDKAGNSSVQNHSWSVAAAATPTPAPTVTPAPTSTPVPGAPSQLALDYVNKNWPTLRERLKGYTNIYDIQIVVQPFVEWIAEYNRQDLAREVLDVYAMNLKTMVTQTDLILHDGSKVPALKPFQTWMHPGDEESILENSQFLFGVSRLVQQLDTTDPRVATWAPVLQSHYLRYVRGIEKDPTKGLFQVWAWGCGGDRYNHNEHIKNLLNDNVYNHSRTYCDVIIDVDMFIIGGTALLLQLHERAPSMNLLTADDVGFLKTYLKTGAALFTKRLTPIQVKVDGATEEGLILDSGRWYGHPDWGYAGNTGSTFPTQKISGAKTLNGDVSHMRRIIPFLEIMRETKAMIGTDFPTDAQMQKIALQNSFGILKDGNVNEPYFVNFADGTDGWYRVNYSGRAGFGYPPGAMTSQWYEGGYCQFSKYEPRAKRICDAALARISGTSAADVAYQQKAGVCHFWDYKPDTCANLQIKQVNFFILNFLSGLR